MRAYRPASLRQLVLLDCVNEIALAERGPIQSVGLIENHFGPIRLASRAMAGTLKHIYGGLEVHAVRVTDNDDRVIAEWKFPIKNVPGFHSPRFGR